MKPLIASLACILAAFPVNSAWADEVFATPPAGCVTLPLHGGRDNLVSLPLVRRAILTSRLRAIATDALTIDLAGVADGALAPSLSGSWTVQFCTGPLEGLCLPITGNTGGVVRVATLGQDLAHHPLGAPSTGDQGDWVKIRPDWTVANVFGATDSEVPLTLAAQTPVGPYLDGDVILLPDNSAAGTEKRPVAQLSFVAGTGWRNCGDATTDWGASRLALGLPFIVRCGGTAARFVAVVGYVLETRFVLPVSGIGNGAERDLAVAFAHPLARPLSASGLVSEDQLRNIVLDSGDPMNPQDLLLEFAGERSGFSLPPAWTFHRQGTTWFSAGVSADAHVLVPASGWILRRRGAHTDSFWVQPAPTWN